jgi:hypothetical protein
MYTGGMALAVLPVLLCSRDSGDVRTCKMEATIMGGFYDDNFGHWECMDDPDVQEFYRQTQRESVEKICVDCGRKVKIRPEYECCNSCADIRERGGF